jgi:TRAP-type transport system periplasmic protein
MKRFYLVGIFFCLLILGAFFVTANDVHAQTLIKVTSWHPVGHPQDVLLKSFCEELQKMAAGKVKVKYYPSGTLASAVQQYDSALKGVSDIGNHVLGYTMGRFPFMQVLDLPIGWPTNGDGTLIATELYNKFKPKEFDEVQVLWLHTAPAEFIHNKVRPITKLEDMKGLKVRCYGSTAQFLTLLGAAPVAMPMSDTYDALTKGVVDGVTANFEAMRGWKFGEQVKYSTENRGTTHGAVFAVVMNKKKYASLPADAQGVINKLSQEYMVKFANMWRDQNAMSREWLKGKGVQIITLTKEEDSRWYETATKPLIAKYIAEMNKAGMPGEEAVQFVKDALKRYGH